MTGQPSAVDVLREHDGTCRWSGSSYSPGWTCGARLPHRETSAGHQVDALAAAGLLATPERLAQERARALGEAAGVVESIDPEWDSALYVGGVYVPVPDWLRARAEAERAGGGV